MNPLDTPPFNTAWYANTLSIAMRMHRGQTRNGQPYWLHVQDVAAKLVELYPDSPRDEVEAALLQDVLETTRHTAAHLRALNVREPVIRIVQAATWDGVTPRAEWLNRLADAGDLPAWRVILAASTVLSDAPDRAATKTVPPYNH